MAKINFLLTNDDGILAPGLRAAARALARLGDVLVVAPAENYSGYGAALPPMHKLAYRPYAGADLDGPNVTAYALAGTPATCAQVGLSGVLGERPIDLVVSGVNAGSNLGRDVLYSGTVGAAITAHLLGVPALAVSLDCGSTGPMHWDSAEWAIREGVGMWLEQRAQGPGQGTLVYNVNVPNRPAATLAGLQLTSCGEHSFLPRYRFERDNPQHGTISAVYHAVYEDDLREKTEPWTDSAAVAQGFVSVTPLRLFPDLLCVTPLNLPAPTQARVEVPSGIQLH
jgi:5'-nucleotidase